MRYIYTLLFIPFLSIAQQIEVADFTHITATIALDATEGSVKGDVTATFIIKQPVKEVYLDAVAMFPDNDTLQDAAIAFTENKIWFYDDFKKGYEYTVQFSYTAKPTKALYFTEGQIWTQGQGKNTSHWLPSIDDINDKIEFDLSFKVAPPVTVIANGVLKKKETTTFVIEKQLSDTIPNSVIKNLESRFNDVGIWQFDMQQPMSSYLVAFVIGNFKKKTFFSESNIPVELYYEPKDSLKVATTYKHSKKIFDFLEQKIGVAYPWQNYKQVPVRDFLYAGMENTGCTIFSEAFVVDAIGYNDKNYVNVNAHELAHQWFGNLVTAAGGKDHWLHEGFATYYALLAEKQIFGDAYYYWKLLTTAEQLQQLSDGGKGQSLRNPKASSLTFYEKGAWALHVLNELIGEEAFDQAISNYIKKYQFKNVTTDNFIEEVKAVTAVDISGWYQDWITQSAFKAYEAYQSLIKNDFIKEYFALVALRPQPLTEKYTLLKNIISSKNTNPYLFEEAILQLSLEDLDATQNLYELAFMTKDVHKRQALAFSFTEKIPPVFQSKYESFLKDPSYHTIAFALPNLINSFYDKHTTYLDQTAHIVGFQDKNVRITWLQYAILIKEYKISEKENFVKELISYTAPQYSFEVRQKAFEGLDMIALNGTNIINEVAVKNAINASTHHYWRFRDFARGYLNNLLAKTAMRALVLKVHPQLSEKEKAYLKRIDFKIAK